MIIDLDYINDRIKTLEFRIAHPNEYNLTPTIKVKINDGAVYKEELATLKNIKKCILKTQEMEKENAELKRVLEVLFKKQVDLGWLWYCVHECINSLDEYNKKMPIEKFKLTQEEFDLLKRWVEND